MEKFENLNVVREKFVSIRSAMDEKQIDDALGFKTKKDKILSLFSIRYKPSKKLLNEGVLVYVYIYKMNYFLHGNSNYYKSWILFSPSLKFEENPTSYRKIAAELEYFLKSKNKKYKKIIRHLLNKENDFKLLELPFEIFNEKVFISTIYTKEKVNPSLNLGVNLCLLNRKGSKNIIFLPEICYSQKQK